MINIDSEVRKTQQDGFKEADAIAKVCQDIILDAIQFFISLSFSLNIFLYSSHSSQR